jgi:hygromycin-B 7''-O-kinase
MSAEASTQTSILDLPHKEQLFMQGRIYSQRLGMITDEQFQAALDCFKLGHFLRAEPIPFGLFGQNVFITSSEGEYVLRGQPHFPWQFATEQFFAQLLHERTQVPVPWPYLIQPSTEIFGWSFVLMPRMTGLQLADPQVKTQLGSANRRGIAHAFGENLARIQDVKWSTSGRYNAATKSVEPFDLAQELASPFPVESDAQLASMPPTSITYSERVKVVIRQLLARSRTYNVAATTPEDIHWVEDLIADAQDTLDDTFEPCLLMEDYKEENVVVMQQHGEWRVSGVFDLMTAHFGDGEADLSRSIAWYLERDPRLAQEFLDAYHCQKPPRPGFARRFPIYMLLDRAILWDYFQRSGVRWWDESWTFRDWASQYTSPDIAL